MRLAIEKRTKLITLTYNEFLTRTNVRNHRVTSYMSSSVVLEKIARRNGVNPSQTIYKAGYWRYPQLTEYFQPRLYVYTSRSSISVKAHASLTGILIPFHRGGGSDVCNRNNSWYVSAL